MCDPARLCGTRCCIFVGSQVFGRTGPINLSHASMQALVNTSPVESHPVSLLCPKQGHVPAPDSPTELTSRCSQKAAKLERRHSPAGCRWRVCLPLQKSEFAGRWRICLCYRHGTPSCRAGMGPWGERQGHRGWAQGKPS